MLDETMHKSAVFFCVGGGDTNGKGAIMVGSVKNPGPTFNGGEAGVFSTTMLVAGMTLACVVATCGSIVVMVGITLEGVVNPYRSWEVSWSTITIFPSWGNIMRCKTVNTMARMAYM